MDPLDSNSPDDNSFGGSRMKNWAPSGSSKVKVFGNVSGAPITTSAATAIIAQPGSPAPGPEYTTCIAGVGTAPGSHGPHHTRNWLPFAKVTVDWLARVKTSVFSFTGT